MMSDTTKTPGVLLTGKMYDITKEVAQTILPGVGTLYAAIAVIWGLPAAVEVVGTIGAVDTFLGLLLKASSATYENSGAKYSGAVNFQRTDDTKVFTVDLNDRPDDLIDKDEVTLKVNKPSDPNAPA